MNDLATAAAAPLVSADVPPKIKVRDVHFYYNGFHAIKGINMDIPEKQVTAIIGPSGCGKSTMLRIFNRIYAIYPKQEAKGSIELDGENVLDPNYSMNRLRTKVGMVFQKPVPFPMTIFENVAYGIRHHEKLSRADMDVRVEQALRSAALWDEVKDKLKQSALGLSGGQQQRLCIARGIALRPEVLLLGRTHFGARSDCHQPHRAVSRRAEARIHHRDRHPQHAAGSALFRPHRLYVSGRADRVRQHRKNLYQTRQKADRRLHHRSFWLSASAPSPLWGEGWGEGSIRREPTSAVARTLPYLIFNEAPP